MKTLIAGLIILGLTGCVSAQGVETARGMDDARVAGGSGWSECPRGTVDVQFVSIEEMNKLRAAACKTGSSTSRGCSGPAASLNTGGTVYATDLNSAIYEISLLCGWGNNV